MGGEVKEQDDIRRATLACRAGVRLLDEGGTRGKKWNFGSRIVDRESGD